MKIPGLILKQMYTLGSLENVEDGVQFSLKNRLSNATVVGLTEVRINGRAVPLDRVTLEMNGERVAASAITPTSAIAFPLARDGEHVDMLIIVFTREDAPDKPQP